MIAHRLNCMPLCDRVVVMEHGEKSDEGAHHELLELHKVYYSLWQSQTYS